MDYLQAIVCTHRWLQRLSLGWAKYPKFASTCDLYVPPAGASTSHRKLRQTKPEKRGEKLNPPDSEWFQSPQRPGLGAGFTRLIVDYPEGGQTSMSRWPVCRHIRRLAAVASTDDAAAAAAVKVILPDSQEHHVLHFSQ